MGPKVKIADIEKKLEEWGVGAFESVIRNGGTQEEAAQTAFSQKIWARENGVYDLGSKTISVPHSSERE